MTTETVTLQIDSEAAQALRAASAKEREKLGLLLSVWLKEYAKSDTSSLKRTMDEISQKARSRGLTPAILDSILEEE